MLTCISPAEIAKKYKRSSTPMGAEIIPGQVTVWTARPGTIVLNTHEFDNAKTLEIVDGKVITDIGIVFSGN